MPRSLGRHLFPWDPPPSWVLCGSVWETRARHCPRGPQAQVTPSRQGQGPLSVPAAKRLEDNPASVTLGPPAASAPESPTRGYVTASLNQRASFTSAGNLRWLPQMDSGHRLPRSCTEGSVTHTVHSLLPHTRVCPRPASQGPGAGPRLVRGTHRAVRSALATGQAAVLIVSVEDDGKDWRPLQAPRVTGHSCPGPSLAAEAPHFENTQLL